MKNKLFKTLVTFAVFATFIICIPCVAHAAKAEIIPSDDGNILKIHTEKSGEISSVENNLFKREYEHIKVSGKMDNIDLSKLDSMSSHCKSIDLGDAEANNIPPYKFNCKHKLEKFIFPPNLKTIERKCFNDCDNLKEVVLPKNLESIGNYCFYNCYYLNELVLPQSLQSIGEKCFMFCIHLKLDVPANVKIGKYAFGGSKNVTHGMNPIIWEQENTIEKDKDNHKSFIEENKDNHKSFISFITSCFCHQ